MKRSLQKIVVCAILVAGGSLIGIGQTGSVAAVEESNAPSGDVHLGVTARGHVESAKKAQIRSEVNGTASILEIVPEGKRVEAGEILVRLDTSELEEQRKGQQIACEVSRAVVIQAEGAYNLAIVAREEYLEGLYPLELKTVEYEAFLAEEGLYQAKKELERAQQVSDGEPAKEDRLHQAEFAVEKAKRELDLAQTKRDVLVKYTHTKMAEQLQKAVDIAKAKMTSEKTSYQLEGDKLARIEKQLERCVIKAPFAGRVAYYRPPGPNNYRAPRIRKSAVVRRRQTLLDLFDPSQMAFIARIEPSEVSRVKEGTPATIRLDAVPDVKIRGRVEKVQTRTVETRGGDIVQYMDATISLDSPPQELWPGLTGEASIGATGEDMP